MSDPPMLDPTICRHCGAQMREDPEIAGLAYCCGCGRSRDFDH